MLRQSDNNTNKQVFYVSDQRFAAYLISEGASLDNIIAKTDTVEGTVWCTYAFKQPDNAVVEKWQDQDTQHRVRRLLSAFIKLQKDTRAVVNSYKWGATDNTPRGRS